jgi:NDP-sugar pyrophosphorylase family protein
VSAVRETMPTVAILAGGLATRLQPLTLTIPKSMVLVAGEPFIAHQLRLLVRAGVRNVVICCGHLGDQIESFAGDGGGFGCSIHYSHDGPNALGTGGALRKALPRLGRCFMVMYGDSYLPIDLSRVFTEFRRSGKPALMTVYRNAGRFDKSNLDFAEGLVRRYDKMSANPTMKYIDYGLSALTCDCLTEYQSDQAFDLAELYAKLAERRLLAGHEVFERFYEIGTPAGLSETRRFLQRKDSAADRDARHSA